MTRAIRARSFAALRRALILLTGISLLFMLQPSSALALSGTWTNPVINSDAPDPHIFFDGTTYYAYTTNTVIGGAWVNIPVYSSTNLVNWTYRGDAVPNSSIGSWVSASHNGQIWAPSVLQRTNIYNQTYWVMYYTAPSASAGHGCIASAVSYSLTGPFNDNGSPLECDTVYGTGYYDPSVVVTGTGTNPQAHLFWAAATSGGSHYIFADTLDWTGYHSGGTGVQNVMGASSGWQGGIVEAPAVTYDPTAGRYDMFYSGGAWTGPDYAEGWATCTRNGYGVFVSCSDQTPVFALFSRNSGVTGPGGADVFTTPGGQKWFVYHGTNYADCNTPGCNPYGAIPRRMRIDKLNFSGGVPQTAAPTYTAQNF